MVMEKRILLYGLGVTGLALTACVDEYTLPAEVADTYRQEVVVEGRILSGEESVFYVSHTLALTDGRTSEGVTNARVTIVGQNGYESQPATFIGDAEYVVDADELNPNTLYAVRVETEGEIYQSDFQALLDTPEIDELTYRERDEAVSLHVSTHNDNQASRCYMWTYEEDWEFHADVDFVHVSKIPLYNNKTYPLDTPGENPYYYCWGHQNSYSLYIYSTENLSENRVQAYELLRIGMDDVRISYIYSLLVKQWSISEEAYEYYRLMKLYTEESSGLFTPMPSDVRGNIRCVSNPEKGVRGFVTASAVKEKRCFVYASDFKVNTSTYENCQRKIPDLDDVTWRSQWLSDIDYSGAVAFTDEGKLDGSSILYSAQCVDCRKVSGSTKVRPDFWPNEHK